MTQQDAKKPLSSGANEDSPSHSPLAGWVCSVLQNQSLFATKWKESVSWETGRAPEKSCCHEKSFVSWPMWDEVKGSEQGQPRAGDCSFLLRAVAINKDQDLRKKKKKKGRMTWFILLHQWERTALKRHKNNIENNKPGFLEIKAELKADLPAQPDWLMGGTTICWNWLLCLSPSCHLGLCKIEGKKKKTKKKLST